MSVSRRGVLDIMERGVAQRLLCRHLTPSPLSPLWRARSDSQPLARVPKRTLYQLYSRQSLGPDAPRFAVPRMILFNLFRNAIALVFGMYISMTAIALYNKTAIDEVLNLPSESESASLFKPYDPESAEIEAHIQNHRLTQWLRSNPDYSIESRPHTRFPDRWRKTMLTAGLLSGRDRLAVPPLIFKQPGGKSLVSIVYLGPDLCGHPNIIHGGIIATLLDESMAWCCFAALPRHVAVTASLEVDYRAPTPAGSYLAIWAKTVKVEGRKAWVEARVETLPGEGEEPRLLAEGKSVFVEPKQAGVMAMMLPGVE